MREKNPRTIISMEFFPFISSLIVIHTTNQSRHRQISVRINFILFIFSYISSRHTFANSLGGGGNCEDKQH